MSQTERIHQIVNLLDTSHHPVPLQRFLDELEISRATFKRDLAYLRDRLGAPIEWQRGDAGSRGGYRLANSTEPDQIAVRGLWFNPSEIYALLTMHRLASSMQPGLLTKQSRGLLTRITHMLGTADDDPQAVLKYIRIVRSATRRRPSRWFERIARATVRRHRLALTYYTRSRDETTQREVSPQRLLHYRENWYLLAWCHRADALRLFALDAVRKVQPLDQPARRVAQHRLDLGLGQGFGIFGGKARHRAVLRFSAEAARWIADEQWHPEQRSRREGDQLVLEVPYAESRELVMEILRHGADVEVLAPQGLRNEVRETLERMQALYR
jgi:predicted DNA-binding transcriptional regulator YafY